MTKWQYDGWKIIIIIVGKYTVDHGKNCQEVDDFWRVSNQFLQISIYFDHRRRADVYKYYAITHTRIYRYEEKKIVGRNKSNLCIIHIIWFTPIIAITATRGPVNVRSTFSIPYHCYVIVY